MVDTARMGRARKISSKAVLEFKIVSEDPLKAYCLIKGSSSRPYIQIIDLEKKIVGHSCPDFNKSRGNRYSRYGSRSSGGGWCKHLGKLLLMIDPEQVDRVYAVHGQLQTIRQDSQLNAILTDYKQDLLINADSKEDSAEEVNIDDSIQLIHKLIRSNGDIHTLQKVVDGIIPKIKKILDESNSISSLFFIESLVHGMTPEVSVKFDELTGNTFSTNLKEIYTEFITSFWYRTLIYRLEIAYYLKILIKKIGLQKSKNILIIPKSITNDEIIDANLILEYLKRSNKELKQLLGKIAKEEIENRRRRMVHEINIKGSIIPDLVRIVDSSFSMFQMIFDTKVDDLLIYIMKTNNESPTYDVKVNNYQGFTNLPNWLVEDHPAFKFIYDRIKTGGREYITTAEIRGHSKFFSWLRDKSNKEHWIELPRSRVSETIFPPSGILIQWDFNALHTQPNLIESYMGNKKLLIDQTSPIANQIQPFDITICTSDFKDIGNYSLKVFPQHILHPDQVVDLLFQGFKIYSTVLPWDKLSTFIEKGKIDSGDVSLGIAECQSRSFVYGSITLSNELEKLNHLGRKGCSDEQYIDAYTKLKQDTGRLNRESRPVAKEIKLAEGRNLDLILKALYKNETERLQTIVTTIRESPSLAEFRVNLINNSLGKNKIKITKEFMNLLMSSDLGNYNVILPHITKVFDDSYIRLKRMLNTKGSKTQARIRKNILGDVLLNETFTGSFSLNEANLDIFREKIDEMGKYFNN
jgi:hypothetical protein